MSERKWTEAQLEAIHKVADRILVSAAAGSGKTAVLTKRIIEKLTDPSRPADISRMLIVTFTKAAAGELKERIASALSDAIAADPTNKALKRQYVLLGKAKISTIHGFCLDIITRNFDKLGLSPSISVADQTTTSLLMEQVADLVIENYYSELDGFCDIENFVEFADNFISLNDSKLSEILISIYQKVSSFPRGVEFLSDSAKEFQKVIDGNLYQSAWGQIIISHLHEAISYYYGLFASACEYFDDGDIYADKYLPSFIADRELCRSVLFALDSHDMASVKHLISSRTPVNLKALGAEYQTEQTVFYRNMRSDFAAELKESYSTFFAQSDETIRSSAQRSCEIVSKLYRFLRAFENKYSREKSSRGILDFNDLERLSYNLLVNEDGTPSEVALSLSSAYDEIYIDEYQDVNRVQDAIFCAISNRSSRFMVGDIKQSIYAFRGAEPSLFADYRKDTGVDKVFLRHNFRSDKTVIDFVNLVCTELFTSVGKTVPYDETDALVVGKADQINPNAEICIVASDSGKASDRRSDEAKYVAERIKDMIKKGASPSDICILMRSASRSSPLYEAELEALGIPCKNQVAKDLFVNPEVLLAMNILNVIDNPTRDIYLAGALKSPIYNFTLSELIEIRKSYPDISLYSALKRYTAENDFQKGKFFLSKLEEYRARSSDAVHELLWYVMCDTNLFAYATSRDDQSSASGKKANLLKLYEYARSFEKGSFKGLYNFIRYINDVLEGGGGFEAASSASEKENVVRIMTVHQSKGLEFPVVFLCDCASDFSNADSHEKVLIDREYGATLKLSDSSGLASFDTVFRQAALLGIDRKNVDEEIRILYVALTRAKNKLIITASSSDPDKLISGCSALSSPSVPGYKYRLKRNYISWILMASGGKYSPEVHYLDDNNENESLNDNICEAVPQISLDEEHISELCREFSSRFEFRYPFEDVASLPAKLSVSDLYPAILDEIDDSARLAEINEGNMRVPRFIEPNKKSAAEIGTATHQFMQFCDFASLDIGIEDEISRLLVQGFIDAEIASLIDRNAILSFCRSPLFDELKNSDFIKREMRFNISLPADIFAQNPKRKQELEGCTVLVQGVTDCLFNDSKGNLTILDYKTDRIPYEMRNDHAAFERMLKDRHRNQLRYYLASVERMLQRAVGRVAIYSFALGRTVEFSLDELR